MMRLIIVFCLLCVSAFAQQKHRVTLSWTPSVTPTVTKYGIYRGTVSGGPYRLMGYTTGTTFVNGSNPDGTPLQEGAVFYYVVVAFDGVQFSPDSNEFRAVIPVSPRPATAVKGAIE